MSQKPPQWLVEESMEDGQPLNSAPSSSNNAPVAGKSSVLNITVKHKSLIHWVLKGATMCLCCLMGATAIIGISKKMS